MFSTAPVFFSRVAAVQQLLFPDPRPLVERLGTEFFRNLPTGPGVYRMLDARGEVLYVGKAKNLRRRLASYRVANPGGKNRRQIRLVANAVSVEIEVCDNERAALQREAELLRFLRPRFNRAGTWPAPQRYLLWRAAAGNLEVAIAEVKRAGWLGIGPVGSPRARMLRGALIRLLWVASHPETGLSGMPHGWAHGTFGETAALPLGEGADEFTALLRFFSVGSPEPLCVSLRKRLEGIGPEWLAEVMAEDLETISGASLGGTEATGR